MGGSGFGGVCRHPLLAPRLVRFAFGGGGVGGGAAVFGDGRYAPRGVRPTALWKVYGFRGLVSRNRACLWSLFRIQRVSGA